ncbi:hypothetical protein RJ640_002958 [Escallonia rubra]|uniref:Chalcone/stilbene synthase N-terminal domain-containing protein n=1 Tax=Escallonia rubra TaxID=112253 RepID=A0AA88UCH4_9ASTE|nr:hypothetical protein RJ640_002958 [Escallonia rubra]
MKPRVIYGRLLMGLGGVETGLVGDGRGEVDLVGGLDLFGVAEEGPTTSGVDMPDADYHLTNLLGLRPSVNRLMVYQQGCFTGDTVLRLAKDLTENNAGACVLVVCSEITVVTFRGSSNTHLDSLVRQALFGDGAAAVIVGADPDVSVERPFFTRISMLSPLLLYFDVLAFPLKLTLILSCMLLLLLLLPDFDIPAFIR